jgi:hypothetical protein
MVRINCILARQLESLKFQYGTDGLELKSDNSLDEARSRCQMLAGRTRHTKLCATVDLAQ